MSSSFSSSPTALMPGVLSGPSKSSSSSLYAPVLNFIPLLSSPFPPGDGRLCLFHRTRHQDQPCLVPSLSRLRALRWTLRNTTKRRLHRFSNSPLPPLLPLTILPSHRHRRCNDHAPRPIPRFSFWHPGSSLLNSLCTSFAPRPQTFVPPIHLTTTLALKLFHHKSCPR